MTTSHQRPHRVFSEYRLLLTTKVLLAALMGVAAIGGYVNSTGQIWKLWAAFFAYLVASIVCRFGWTIPLIVLGTILGLSLDPAVKGGTVKTQMLETASWLCCGAISGLLLGLLVDISSHFRPVPGDHENTVDILHI